MPPVFTRCAVDLLRRIDLRLVSTSPAGRVSVSLNVLTGAGAGAMRSGAGGGGAGGGADGLDPPTIADTAPPITVISD